MRERLDQQTTVEQLRDLVESFVAARDWHQFHTPKNLAMSLAIETAELMEHFQWIDSEQSRTLSDETRVAVGEELADCICYALALANELDIDVSDAMFDKMRKNEKKYPAEDFKGRYK